MTEGSAVERIHNFRWRAPDLATAGQPLEVELRAAADAGFEVAIDLGLPDEPGLVRSLGLKFFHIPVIWEPNAVWQAFMQHALMQPV